MEKLEQLMMDKKRLLKSQEELKREIEDVKREIQTEINKNDPEEYCKLIKKWFDKSSAHRYQHGDFILKYKSLRIVIKNHETEVLINYTKISDRQLIEGSVWAYLRPSSPYEALAHVKLRVKKEFFSTKRQGISKRCFRKLLVERLG